MKNITSNPIANPFITLLIVLFSTLLYINTASAEITDTETTVSEQELSDTSAQSLFDAAMDERDSGKVYDSIQKFEYILNRRPSLNRARLELAVSYHRASRFDDAMRQFNIVLDDPETPEKVRLAILAYIGQLKSDQHKPSSDHSFSYYTKMGALYNTNINFAPLRNIQTVGVTDSKKIDSAGVDTFFSASHRYRDSQPFESDGAATILEWQSQISWTGNNYTETNDFDLNILSVSTGPAFLSTGRWRGAINLQLDQIYYGDSALGTFISLNPQLTFDLGNYNGLSFEASITDDNFTRSEDQDRDGNTILAGAAFSTLFDSVNSGLEAGFRVSDHDADDDQFGYKAEQIYFGGFITFAEHSNVYLNLSYKRFDYKAADTLTCSPSPCSTKKRNEDEGRYEIGYNYDFSEGLLQDWTLNTNVSYVRNDTNIDFYEYERELYSINLARYFQ